VVSRMWHLANTMKTVYDIYTTNQQLYSDRLLAFVGNEIVREWSWKDFPFTSFAAQKIIATVTPYTVTGIFNFEVTERTLKELLPKLHYEHWTPISFFRDVFNMSYTLTVQDFFEILICNYRTVRITEEENTKLASMHYKQWRPVDAYEQAGIQIYEKTMWDATF